MPRPKRLIISIGIAGLVVAILAYVGVSVAAAGQITQPYHASPVATAARAVGDFENIDFQSRVDHLHLKGWLFKVATQGNRHSAIIVHGHDTNRVNPNWGALAMSKDLMSRGMDTLVFDLRGVGDSDGEHQTFGTLEPRDVLGAYDFMLARGYPPESMLVIGISTGGDALLEAAADLPRAGALVVDSAPADTRSLLLPHVHERLPALFDAGIIAAAGVFFGLNIELRPIDRVKQLRDRAFLFIVCDADDYVSPQNSDRLWRASSNPESQLVRIHCRQHVSTYKTDRASYLAALSAFTARQIHK